MIFCEENQNSKQVYYRTVIDQKDTGIKSHHLGDALILICAN